MCERRLVRLVVAKKKVWSYPRRVPGYNHPSIILQYACFPLPGKQKTSPITINIFWKSNAVTVKISRLYGGITATGPECVSYVYFFISPKKQIRRKSECSIVRWLLGARKDIRHWFVQIFVAWLQPNTLRTTELVRGVHFQILFPQSAGMTFVIFPHYQKHLLTSIGRIHNKEFALKFNKPKMSCHHWLLQLSKSIIQNQRS